MEIVVFLLLTERFTRKPQVLIAYHDSYIRSYPLSVE